MKMMLLSDLHLRSTTPASRTDNFFHTQLKKFESIIKIYQQNDCMAMLQAGDFFDKPDPGNRVLTAYIKAMEVFAPLRNKPLVVYGQHDQYMRTSGEGRTGLEVMEAAGVLKILKDKPIERGSLKTEQCAVYGMSFGQTTIPDPSGTKDLINILVVHAAVGNKPLFYGHDLSAPKEFLRKCKGFKVVLCGDYHYRFSHINRKRQSIILNTGCLVRQKVEDVDRGLKPHAVIYNTDTAALEWFPIEHEPAKKVFRETISEKVLETNSTLSELVAKVAAQQEAGTNFAQNLMACADHRKASQEVKDFLISELAECRGVAE